ncbi:hypothetical protein Pst134EA_004877 [Puccinia striiformis f. sp. tritici]|uniref:hypothetical protein n=1 Tax=Puccinia striiformis f. sp. tritici TaxID=168172 RepID=UPI00200732E5|nr:hypothetical protein Pst134EA_004877 [Puccinia striiformis f. sp. tritici]KAH9470967.1 hypothetical protein Pst134EA_004877 [Puccinia striiformis f. sp. tritici]
MLMIFTFETHSPGDVVRLLNLSVDLNELKFNRRLGLDRHYTPQMVLGLAESLSLKARILTSK